ncbi:MAG: hypothetical protein IT458_00655 [Planctomycetes bacterium]|nr:hypothetical protein [Planctomycetota bacterium]
MDYDAARAEFVVFGGHAFPGPDLGDTWTFNGTAWRLRTVPVPPSARHGAAFAYDSSQGLTVLFGGQQDQGAILGDTWMWNGTTWSRMTPIVSPPPRVGAGCAADTRRGRIVIFGGWGSQGMITVPDTWAWHGGSGTWTNVLPPSSPTPRYFTTMAYDAARDRIVLFGGANAQGHLADTWEFDGTRWYQVMTSSAPPARADSRMVYSALLGGVVIFGGSNVTGIRYSDTWLYDGTNWRMVRPAAPASAPSARDGAGMAVESGTGKILVVQGRTGNGAFANDTWWLDIPGFVSFGVGCGPNGGPRLAGSFGQDPTAGMPYSMTISNLPPLLPPSSVFLLLGANELVPAVDLGSIGMTGCRLYANPTYLVPCTYIPVGVASCTVGMPNAPGFMFFVQGLAIVPAGNPLGLILSDAARGIIR